MLVWHPLPGTPTLTTSSPVPSIPTCTHSFLFFKLFIYIYLFILVTCGACLSPPNTLPLKTHTVEVLMQCCGWTSTPWPLLDWTAPSRHGPSRIKCSIVRIFVSPPFFIVIIIFHFLKIFFWYMKGKDTGVKIKIIPVGILIYDTYLLL